jgi:predicted PurR-regulated permease PerM
MQDKGNLLLKLTLLVIAAVAIGMFLFSIAEIVKLVIIAGLLAYILDPLANILESRGMSRTSATVGIFTGIVLLSVFSYFVFLPLLSEEIKSLKSGFGPEQTGVMISRLEAFLVTNLSFVGVRELNIAGKLQGAMSHTGEWIVNHVLDAASVVTSLILIPFIVFFLLKDGREFKKAFVTLVPNRYFEFTLYLLYKLDAQVGNYLRGQFIDAAIIGILSFCALWFIGIKYYFLIGVFTGFANLIPYFGPITGALLATFVSVLQTGGFHMALYVILAFTVIKLIDDAIVQPVVVAKSVDMNPLTVLLAILVGGKLFGILGMLLSVPVAGFIKVVVRESIINYRKYRAI